MQSRTTFIKTRASLVILTLMLALTSCKKNIEVDPPALSVSNANVYKTDATAIAALTGIYSTMSNVTDGAGFTGIGSISLLSGLSSDELTLYSGVADNKLIAYYKNALVATSQFNNYGSELWAGGAGLYYYIFICNAAIEGLSRSITLTPSVKQQLLGEAKFMRAFFYFHLVNYFGDVPLALTTDPSVNAVLARTPKQQVYQQIINDLKEAQNLLSSTFLDGTLSNYLGNPERVRPTKWAATALLARAYLYNYEYANAEIQSTLIIQQTALFGITSLNNAFLKNSNEAVWQLQTVTTGRNTEDAFTFIIPSTGPSGSINPVFLSNQLLNSFESGDQRKINWVGSVTPSPGTTTYYFPYKYKATTTSGSATEYLTVMRLAEQYLIRAEARAQQNNINGAQTDLNTIRTRAGLGVTSANDQPSLLTAILHERQTELFTEFGNRWLDLKRTNNVNTVMSNVTPIKGGTWQTTDQLYPIPFADILKNPNLIQNQGY